jgi:hypothetical protein
MWVGDERPIKASKNNLYSYISSVNGGTSGFVVITGNFSSKSFP